MKKIAKFEKVSFEQFEKAVKDIFGSKYNSNSIKDAYDKIELPTRATTGSAGYDFKCPLIVENFKGESTMIPTGIRVKINEGWVLKLYPRSGIGCRRGMRLSNTVGIIDSDYYYSDNEGHIMAKIEHNLGDYLLLLKPGDAFIQGVFVEYGITEDDNANNIRNGGFGSTGG